MRCLVFVKFLPGGSLAPEEFFARLNAQWWWLEDHNDSTERHTPSSRSAICIADYESVEQLALDLSIMPGAGISNVEVVPILEKIGHQRRKKNENESLDISSNASGIKVT